MIVLLQVDAPGANLKRKRKSCSLSTTPRIAADAIKRIGQRNKERSDTKHGTGQPAQAREAQALKRPRIDVHENKTGRERQATWEKAAQERQAKSKKAGTVAPEAPASVYQAAHKEWADQVLEEQAKQLHQRGSAGYLDQLPKPVQCEIRQKVASEVAARHHILPSEVIHSQAAFTGTGHSLRDSGVRRH